MLSVHPRMAAFRPMRSVCEREQVREEVARQQLMQVSDQDRDQEEAKKGRRLVQLGR
jgi:hypothetical protein